MSQMKKTREKKKFPKLSLRCDTNKTRISHSPHIKEKISSYFSTIKDNDSSDNSSEESNINEEIQIRPTTSEMVNKLVTNGDENDFASPKTLNQPKSFQSKIQNSVRKTRKRAKSKKNSSDLSKFVIAQSSGSDTNPESLQLALALSKSIQEAENPEIINTEEFYESSFNYPSTQQKVAGIKKTLEQFGFKSNKPTGANDLSKFLSNQSQQTRKKFKYITPTLYLRTEIDRKKMVETRVSQILTNIAIYNKNNSNLHLSTENSELINNKPKSFLLRDYYNPDMPVFLKNCQDLPEIENKLFYTNLVVPSEVKCGSLLRDWNIIPGREKTPVKIIISKTIDNTNREKNAENVIENTSEDFFNQDTERLDLPTYVNNEKKSSLNRSITPDLFSDTEFENFNSSRNPSSAKSPLHEDNSSGNTDKSIQNVSVIKNKFIDSALYNLPVNSEGASSDSHSVSLLDNVSPRRKKNNSPFKKSDRKMTNFARKNIFDNNKTIISSSDSEIESVSLLDIISPRRRKTISPDKNDKSIYNSVRKNIFDAKITAFNGEPSRENHIKQDEKSTSFLEEKRDIVCATKTKKSVKNNNILHYESFNSNGDVLSDDCLNLTQSSDDSISLKNSELLHTTNNEKSDLIISKPNNTLCDLKNVNASEIKSKSNMKGYKPNEIPTDILNATGEENGFLNVTELIDMTETNGKSHNESEESDDGIVDLTQSSTELEDDGEDDIDDLFENREDNYSPELNLFDSSKNAEFYRSLDYLPSSDSDDNDGENKYSKYKTFAQCDSPATNGNSVKGGKRKASEYNNPELSDTTESRKSSDSEFDSNSNNISSIPFNTKGRSGKNNKITDGMHKSKASLMRKSSEESEKSLTEINNSPQRIYENIHKAEDVSLSQSTSDAEISDEELNYSVTKTGKKLSSGNNNMEINIHEKEQSKKQNAQKTEYVSVSDIEISDEELNYSVTKAGKKSSGKNDQITDSPSILEKEQSKKQSSENIENISLSQSASDIEISDEELNYSVTKPIKKLDKSEKNKSAYKLPIDMSPSERVDNLDEDDLQFLSQSSPDSSDVNDDEINYSSTTPYKKIKLEKEDDKSEEKKMEENENIDPDETFNYYPSMECEHMDFLAGNCDKILETVSTNLTPLTEQIKQSEALKHPRVKDLSTPKSTKFKFSNNQRSALEDSFNEVLENNEILENISDFGDEDTVQAKTPENQNIAQEVITPNSALIIKTTNVTPMPNYSDMDTPERNKELERYGLKPLKRAKGKKILRYIYDATHPVSDNTEKVRSSSSDEDDKIVKRRKKDNMETNNLDTDYAKPQKEKNSDIENAEPEITGTIEILGDLIAGSESDENMIFERKQPSKILSCRIPLHIVWHNLVSSNVELHEKILLYEPIQVEEIYKKLKSMGYKFHIEDLIAFFDKKCITIRTAQKSHRKKAGTSRKIK